MVSLAVISLGVIVAIVEIVPGMAASKNSSQKPVLAYVSGEIILGGLFPVHGKGTKNEACGDINPDRGLQRVEAMLFTIDEINNDDTLLPNIKLGTNIFDTCGRSTHALEQSLEFIRGSLSVADASEFVCQDGSPAKPKHPLTTVAGVIGGSYSSVSIQVANLLRLFNIPQISYASTSVALSDKTRFDYFVRTVPPDSYQAKALVDIVDYFNWTYVSAVYSEGTYGESGIEYFVHEARKRNICIALSVKIPSRSNKDTFNKIITRLMEKKRARVVIVFVRMEDARDLLIAASNITNHFVWIAADGWGVQDVQSGEESNLVSEGAITIDLHSQPIPPFDTYFTNLHPSTNLRNPWFAEYWEKLHKCKLKETSESPGPMCDGSERITPGHYKQESKVQFIYDAVYAMAISIDKLRQKHCKGVSVRPCDAIYHINGEELLNDFLRNISFTDAYGGLVEFDERGDALGRYRILNYRQNRTTRKFEYKEIGQWMNDLHFEDIDIVWAGGTFDIPTSRCSEPCRPYEIKRMESGEPCCWYCTKCEPQEYLKDEFTCEPCGEGKWPVANKRSCYSLQLQYMQWLSAYALVPICLSLLGIVVTVAVIVTFMRFNNTPVVMASGRELSYVLLCGCLVCYGMTFALLAKPSAIVCSIQRFGVGFGFSVIYSAILTKTNRISRIFDSARRSARRPPFISPRSQIVITLILISIQVVFTVIWLVLETPGTRRHVSDDLQTVVLKCTVDDLSFLVSLIYNMLLIIICTVYAVKTRKIPENFNESKFIGFAMYTTCIIWLAFVPIYFGTLNSFQVQITTLCVSISLSSTVALVCLFTPKLYIIIFQPEKNVRKLTLNSSRIKTGTSGVGTSANHTDYHALGDRPTTGDYNEITTDCGPVLPPNIPACNTCGLFFGQGVPCERIKFNVQNQAITCANDNETDKDSVASL